MTNKIVVLFSEGPTEVEFYKALVKSVRTIMNCPFDCEILYKDMKGVGNYKKDALRKFNHIKKGNPNSEIFVFMCIDSDAFEFSKKPPFNKMEVKKSLIQAGAKQVTYIVANKSIEDWFLSDFQNVLSYLRLPKSTIKPAGNGQDVLKSLFRRANKIYTKGGKAEGFIEKLNVPLILEKHCKSIKPLCSALLLDCKKVCNKSNK